MRFNFLPLIGLCVALALALAAPGMPYAADAIRVYAADDLPDEQELARLLQGNEVVTEPPATRGVRIVGQPSRTVAASTPTRYRGFALPLPFARDSSTPAPAARAQLMAVARAIAQLPTGTVVHVEGHTDASGDLTWNLDLSLARALAIRSWLVREFHIPGEMLVAVGKGPREPLPGTHPYAASNRRVQFRIV